MDMQKFSAYNRTRSEHARGFDHPLSAWSASDWMVALVGEVGEAANDLKKLNRIRAKLRGNKDGETRELLTQKLRKELADIYAYTDLLTQRLDEDLASLVAGKFNEVSERVGFDALPPLYVEARRSRMQRTPWFYNEDPAYHGVYEVETRVYAGDSGYEGLAFWDCAGWSEALQTNEGLKRFVFIGPRVRCWRGRVMP